MRETGFNFVYVYLAQHVAALLHTYTKIIYTKIEKKNISMFKTWKNNIFLYLLARAYRIIDNTLWQANTENCGPQFGNKFDIEVGQRSWSRSRHGTIGKVFSQEHTCQVSKLYL